MTWTHRPDAQASPSTARHRGARHRALDASDEEIERGEHAWRLRTRARFSRGSPVTCSMKTALSLAVLIAACNGHQTPTPTSPEAPNEPAPPPEDPPRETE